MELWSSNPSCPFQFKKYTGASPLVAVCLLTLFVCICVESAVNIPEDKKFTSLIVLGDSIVDPGNNNDMSTPTKANFPPYGRDFKGGVATGRFSNGLVPTDIVAQELSIKELIPAYMDPNLQPDDLINGVSFASGGSGLDPVTAALETARPISEQLDQFKEYKSRLDSLVGEDQANHIVSRALFGVVAGSNDLVNTYFSFGIRKHQYNISTYTTVLADFATDLLNDLYGLGARRIGIFNAPPIGCLPFPRTLAGGADRQCVESYNDGSILFNSKLAARVESFNNENSDAKAVIIDIYYPLLDLIRNPQEHGFEVVNKGCCGTGELEAAVLCNKLSHTCPDPSKYIFWDSFHPTQATYKYLISKIIGSVVPQFF
uniref:GDSL esterase/lipase EXL3 n=1 Tax=Kalanchoe fedtschenkoi TaxID=63787 RepID=A0A7N0SZY9_KALFE